MHALDFVFCFVSSACMNNFSLSLCMDMLFDPHVHTDGTSNDETTIERERVTIILHMLLNLSIHTHTYIHICFTCGG